MQYGQIAIRLDNVGKKYKKHEVLKSVSLSIKAGEGFALLGPNGAGKTTLLKMIAGLVRPTSGKIYLFEQNTSPRTKMMKQAVGLVPQDNTLERELTVGEALRIYGRLFQIRKLDQRLASLAETFCLKPVWNQRISVLSGGTARRVLIARTLLPEPRILLLDEPTVGLDPAVRADIWSCIRNVIAEGVTLVLTTHYMEEAEQLCERVAMLRDGRLALTDTVAALKEKTGLISGGEALESVFLHVSRGGE